MAVRDNEVGAAAMGIPVVRTKLLAFALSGFMAGYAGVCLAFALRALLDIDRFDPTFSFLVVSMVVIGGTGLDPRSRARRALPRRDCLRSSGPLQTIQFLTSGLGLLAFILYLPGGLAQVLAPAGGPRHERCRHWRGQDPLRGGQPARVRRAPLEGVTGVGAPRGGSRA